MVNAVDMVWQHAADRGSSTAVMGDGVDWSYDELRRRITSWAVRLRDFTAPDGAPGYFEQELSVYGRGGLPCPACGRPLRQAEPQLRIGRHLGREQRHDVRAATEGRGFYIPRFKGELEVRVQTKALRISGRYREGLLRFVPPRWRERTDGYLEESKENLRRWLSFDLLTGRVDRKHRMWPYLRRFGATDEIILVPVGPLSNVATALLREPRLKDRIPYAQRGETRIA